MKKLLAFVALILGPVQGRALAGDPGLPARLESIVQSYAAKNQVAGFSVRVQWRGQTLLNKGYGQAAFESLRPARPDTVYAIGSQTKQFAAAAILQLADRHLLDLDEDVHRIIPEYPTQPRPVTLRHLLSHTSGVPDYFPDDDANPGMVLKPISEADILARFVQLPLDFASSSNFAYSNSNFYLLGLVIERLTGEKFNAYLHHHLFQPLGLNLAECGSKSLSRQMANGYLVDGSGKFIATPDFDMSWGFAAGNLCGTTGDMIRWFQALHRGNILTNWAYSVMTTPAVLDDGTPTTYGAGLFLDRIAGHRHFEHGGDTRTFSSQGSYYPDDDLAIAVLTNTEGPFDRFGLERDLGREVLGLPPEALNPVPLPAPFGSSLAGAYKVMGREVFGPNPTTITVEGSKAIVSTSGKNIPFVYIGEGRFQLDAGRRDTFITFPEVDGDEPFFVIFIREIMVGRGMRNTQPPSSTAQVVNIQGRRPLHELFSRAATQ